MAEEPMDMDTLIEKALSGEPMRPVPLTLHRRVAERVRIAALRERERTRFRYSMATLAVGFLGIVGAAGLLISITNLDVVLNSGIAGGKGQYDYYATSMALTWEDYSGAYSLGLSVLLAFGTVILGIIPLRRYLPSL